MSDEEFLKKLDEIQKDVDQKNILEDFDPEDREPNAEGGLTRTSYALGKGPVLPSDEDPINPFQPKPTGPVLPDKMASAPDVMDSLNDLANMLFGKNLDQLTEEEYDSLLDAARDSRATGGLAGIINL